MGTNKRYPNLGPQLAEQRELREARRRGPLHTLTDEQIALHRSIVSIPPERVTMWALAWIHFGDTAVRCTVRMLRWTDDAVNVEVELADEALRCWVWRGAVNQLAKREDAWR